MAIIIGTQQGETLNGSLGVVDDQIFGLAGNDTLRRAWCRRPPGHRACHCRPRP